jgi:hypothetical protein
MFRIENEADPLRELSDYDIRHLTEHLSFAGDNTYLHQLLSLSGGIPAAGSAASGVNAWYAAKERIADIDGYLNDVTHAWRTAESQAADLLVGLGRQVRYLLLIVSARSFAKTIPAMLFPLLVDAGLLPLELALAHSRLMSDDDKVSSLAELVVRLPAGEQDRVIPELVAAANVIRNDPGYISRRLASTAKLVLNPGKALEVAWAIPRAEIRVAALAALARRLPEPASADLLTTAVTTARETLWRDRDEAFAAIAPFLPEAETILEIADQIEDPGYRARALVAAAATLPEPRRTEVVKKAVGLASQASGSAKDQALRAAAALLPSQEALATARAIWFYPPRIDALADIALRLPKNKRGPVWAEALAAAREAPAADDLANALRQLAALMPPAEREDVLTEALSAARKVWNDNQGYQAKALASLVSLLPSQQRAAVMTEAVESARSANNPGSRAWTLANVAAELPTELRKPVLAEALTQARAIEDGDTRTATVLALASHLPAEERAELLWDALAVARTAQTPEVRGRLLATIVTLMPEQHRAAIGHEALEAVRHGGPGFARAGVIETVTMSLPEDEAAHIFDMEIQAAIAEANDESDRVLGQAAWHDPDRRGALVAARAITRPADRASALVTVAQRLGDKQQATVMGEALAAAREVSDPKERNEALSTVVAHLPDTERPSIVAEMQAAAQKIRDPSGQTEYYQSWAYVNTVRGMPDPQKALGVALKIANSFARFTALESVVQRLQPDEREPVLAAMLASIRDENNESHRLYKLGILVNLLPSPGPVLDEARALEARHIRAKALGLIAENLAPPERALVLAEAVAEAEKEPYPVFRFQALVQLANSVPSAQRTGVLTAALAAVGGLKEARDKAQHLAEVLQFQDVPLDNLYTACRDLLHDLAGSERREILDILAMLAPVLARLGGAAAVSGAISAISDTGHWFP